MSTPTLELATQLVTSLYVVQRHASEVAIQFYTDSTIGPPSDAVSAPITAVMENLNTAAQDALDAVLDARTPDLTPANALLNTVGLMWGAHEDGGWNE